MAIGYGFWDTGSELPVSMVISVSGVIPMDVSSLANWEVYSLRVCPVLIECLVSGYDEVDQKYLVVPVLPSSFEESHY